jgi:hypothetical protein
LRRAREGYSAERLPDIGPDGGRHGVFTDEGELVDVGVLGCLSGGSRKNWAGIACDEDGKGAR